jgi:hypothetical protein
LAVASQTVETGAPLPTSALIKRLELGEIMDTEYLDRLAHQLKVNKAPACRRAINRILEEMKKRCENGEYRDRMEAASAFRKLVEDEGSCQKV